MQIINENFIHISTVHHHHYTFFFQKNKNIIWYNDVEKDGWTNVIYSLSVCLSLVYMDMACDDGYVIVNIRRLSRDKNIKTNVLIYIIR